MSKVQLKLWLDPQEADALRSKAQAESLTLGELVVRVLGLRVPKETESQILQRLETLEQAIESVDYEASIGDLDKRLQRFEQMAGDGWG